uniref:Uncharacterized protein n=1 Tax=Ditylenchus dipsaci TaxID=166011 RepID=A0A915CWM9_9BILA
MVGGTSTFRIKSMSVDPAMLVALQVYLPPSCIPPEIFPEKQNVTVNLEETIILPCNASGIPEPVVSWVKAPHKDIIGNEEKYQILGTSLAIKKISASDDGFYHCIAKSEAGQAIGLRRINVNLPRNANKNIWVECDENGQPVKSTTYVPARGDRPQSPNDYLHWDTEYQQLPENGTDGVLISCLPSHRGPRRVPVNTLPHFVETPLNTMINPGAELRLHCSAMGSPTPAIFWLKDGQLLEEFRSLDGSSILQLQAVNKSIAGQYVCAARNQIGENRAFAEVSLGAGDWDANPFSIAKLLRDRSKLRPVTVLQCFNGTHLERHRVAWTVDGRKVGQLDESLHALNNGSMALFYFASQEELSAFGCKIRDQPGRVHLGGQVEVHDVVPRALIRPTRIYSHPKMDITIDCKLKTGSALTTKVQWSKNNVNLEPDFDKLEVMPNNSLVIRTVIDSDRGSYKCRSWNSQGKSWDDVDLIIEDVPDAVVGQFSGSINGNQVQETHGKMVLAQIEPQLDSNDILMQIDNLPKNIAKSSAKATKTLVSIMSMPLAQLGYDPDGPETAMDSNRTTSNGSMAKFERLIEYSFQSGEKMRVKQSGDGIEQGKMMMSVDFQGSVPQIDESPFSFEPMNEDLVEVSPGKVTGLGNSAVNFGKNRRVSFKWEDKITYDPSSDDTKMIEPGSTMHIQARPKLENDSSSIRMQVKVDRFGYCPSGYAKIRDTCRVLQTFFSQPQHTPLNQFRCERVRSGRRHLRRGSECKNTQGSFECERRCESGFHASADGECIDQDECSLGLDNCEASTECYNIEGSFECIESCADGFYHNTESICEDINECQLDDPCNPPMFCENLLGSFKCLCPAGFPIANDTCQGISMDPLNPLKWFMWDSGQSVCADLDECAFDAPCQFDCTNTAGTYECSCPDGYALNDQGQCIDINECDAESACDEGEVCFNQLGEYSCIRNPCPRNYRLDHLKAQCLPRCQNCSDVPINLHMLAVPKGLGADTPLVRLSAHDKAGRVLRNTNFHIMADKMEGTRGLVPHTGPYHSPLPFYLKTKKGRATVHNQLKLLAGSLHKIPIRSSSMNKEGEIPGIKTPAEQLKVVEGKEQRLECIVTGIPLPKVEWRRNGDPMDDGRDHHTSTAGNSHFLHIHNTNISMLVGTAVWQPIELVRHGRIFNSIPPTIGDGERIMKVAEGSQLALDCLAKGHPTPEIVWRKNGATITPTLKTRLLLENLTSGENGRYTCEATNEAGTAVADFVVEVLIKPRMKDHSAELRVVEGERAKLDCKADGYPEPTIKWMRGGRPITDMTNFILSPRGETLMILRTKRSDGGAYSCNVKNSAGEIEAPFTVIVLTAPHIEQTIDQNPRVINNNSIVLDCPILGHPRPEVVWMKEGKILTYDLNMVKEGQNNLKIHRISVSDAGRYTCFAKNEVGSLNTDYQLEVLAPPKFGAEGQRIFEVVEGDSVTISCPVEAVPLPEIEWLRGVNPIYSSDNVRVSEESKKVTIVKTTLHDGGKYTCKATNIAGSTDIDLILKVLVPPTIDKSNLISNPLAIFGREIFLECPASGIPQPTILWTRDGVVIDVENSDEGKYSLHQSNQSFGINKIEASDQGKYTCEVQNKGGKTSEQFMVEVLEPPQMETTEPQKLTKREGDLLTLVCPVKNEDVEVDSELRVTWTKDGRPWNQLTHLIMRSPTKDVDCN